MKSATEMLINVLQQWKTRFKNNKAAKFALKFVSLPELVATSV